MNNGDEKALGDKDYLKEYEINIEMWKHYDNLRQDKNTKFLTANTVLAAVWGITVKEKTGDPIFILYVTLVISLIGLAICILWFLLLSRNSAYIDFHRSRINSLESLANHKFETFKLQWEKFKTSQKQKETKIGKLRWWESFSSYTTEGFLPVVTAMFWILMALSLCFVSTA